MVVTESGLFTVAVFQDAAWASKGLEALKRAGFPKEAMTILAKETPEASALLQDTFSNAASRIDIPPFGAVLAHGRLVEALQGSSRDLGKLGLAATMRRVGFQPHDGRIFETLVGRGGVLVAIRSEPRAADALAILHSYGGGNAAIGAWTGRV
jgi:alkylhydroperoxidase/carboxymuconolactone decarboxylase family protein YurZ